MQTNIKLKDIIKAIQACAKKNSVEPHEVTKTMLASDGYEFSEWTYRKYGSFNAIMSAHFPNPDKSLADIKKNKNANSYIKKLENIVGDQELFQDTLIEAVKTGLAPLPKVKQQLKFNNKAKHQREWVMMLNDTHFGLIVHKDEVNSVNQFDWQAACRRTAMVVDELINYKPHAIKEVSKVHLVINGDIIQGLIHGANTQGQDLFIHQLNGTLHILTYTIEALLKTFPEVMVHGIAGNHCDALHKREGGRVVQEKYDSYTNVVLYALSAAFRNNKDRVSFNFPKTPYVHFDLPNGRVMAAHGDTLFSKSLGNPGTSINVKGLSDAINRFNSGEVAQGRDPIKLMLFGHVHSYAHFMTHDGVQVYIAPSLSGTDAYAHQLNINHNLAAQVIFESTEDFIMGDSRLVQVTMADNNPKYDKIIPTFKRRLTFD